MKKPTVVNGHFYAELTWFYGELLKIDVYQKHSNVYVVYFVVRSNFSFFSLICISTLFHDFYATFSRSSSTLDTCACDGLFDDDSPYGARSDCGVLLHDVSSNGGVRPYYPSSDYTRADDVHNNYAGFNDNGSDRVQSHDPDCPDFDSSNDIR